MNKNSLRFSLSEKLHPQDTLLQTYGCRHTNPDICGSCELENICAFTRDDHICKKPSASWKKYFDKLSGLEKI